MGLFFPVEEGLAFSLVPYFKFLFKTPNIDPTFVKLLRQVSLDSLTQDEVYRVGGRGANKRQGKPTSAELLHQPRSQVLGHRTEAGKDETVLDLTALLSAWCVSHATRVTSPSLCPPATAGRNHKDVSNLGEKCPVYKICKCPQASLMFPAVCETLSLKMHFPSKTLQSKLSRLPGYLTIQMVRFYYKEKESVNAKVLKVGLQFPTFSLSKWSLTSNLELKLLFCFPLLQDVKFTMTLDVYELCTAELQEKMLPIRSKFKEVEDKKLEKQQQKVSQKGLICSR